MTAGIIYHIPDPLAAADWSRKPHALASGFMSAEGAGTSGAAPAERAAAFLRIHIAGRVALALGGSLVGESTTITRTEGKADV